MRGPFQDDWVSGETHPHGHAAEDFPHDEVARRIDGDESDVHTAIEMASTAVRQMMCWAIDVRSRESKSVEVRMLAMAWNVNPNIFDGISLNEIAKRYNISPDALHRASGDFRRRFKVSNLAHLHAWNFKSAKP